MLRVDRPNKIVDLVVKFHANGVIFSHRHLADDADFRYAGRTSYLRIGRQPEGSAPDGDLRCQCARRCA